VSRIVFVLAAVSLGSAPAFAQRGAAPTTHGPAPQAAAAHPVAPTPTTHGNPHTTTAVHGAAATHGKPTTTSTTTAHASTTTTPTTSTTTLNPIAQKISANHGLQPKMARLLPANMTLDQASLGFKNQGQFIAALHVSKNLGIPFADLKTAMTGIRPVTGTTSPTSTTTTSQPTMSLGQAIHKLRPSADADAATTTAVHQASVDVGVTATSTTTTTTTSATTKKNGK